MPLFLLKRDFITSVAFQQLLAESMCMYFQWIWSILDGIPLCVKKCPIPISFLKRARLMSQTNTQVNHLSLSTQIVCFYVI